MSVDPITISGSLIIARLTKLKLTINVMSQELEFVKSLINYIKKKQKKLPANAWCNEEEKVYINLLLVLLVIFYKSGHILICCIDFGMLWYFIIIM